MDDTQRTLSPSEKHSSPLSKQIGGGHYKSFAIQPIEFIQANNLGFCEGNIIKYACRYRAKGGIQDLEKVIHYAELLIDDLRMRNKSESMSKIRESLDASYRELERAGHGAIHEGG